MKVGIVEEDSFEILSDDGQMIGGAMVFRHKDVVVNAVGFYRDFDPLPAVTPEMQTFAEVEARKLGMLDKE